MIRATFHTGLIATALLLTGGCERDPASERPGDVTASDVRQEAEQAADTASRYAGQALADYRESMRTRIDSLNEDISTLATKAEGLAGDAKAEADEAIESLETKRDAFVARLSEAALNSQTAWADLKDGLDSAWQELDAARKSAMDRFGG